MATLGSALINKALGHSEAENVFRPWWDKVEDFLVYGLIMLGLMVVPTSMVMGTPLECTFCKGDLCKAYNNTGTVSDPGYYSVWVKKLCTFNGSVDSFMLYFPYILLLIALAMVLIEKIFLALFKANQKLDKFYKLLLDQNIVGQGNKQGVVQTQTREAVEIEEIFKCSEDNYFVSYLIRTSLELMIAVLLLTWITISGVPVIFDDINIIPCKINSFLYVCSGHPQEFYKFILSIAIVFIFLYIITNIYNLLWIIKPNNSNFYNIMKTYRDDLERGSQFKQGKRLDDLYFNNKDMRVLINFLAGNLGVGAACSAISLFDKDFHHSISLMITKTRNNSDDGKAQIRVQKRSEAFLSSMKQNSDFRVKIIVELSPPNEYYPIIFDALDVENDVITFDGLNDDADLSVTARLLVNGKVISTTKHIRNADEEETDAKDDYEREDCDKKNK